MASSNLISKAVSITKYSARQHFGDNIWTSYEREIPNVPWKMRMLFHQIMFAFPWNRVKTIIVLYKYEVVNHVGKKNLRFPEIIFFIMAILFPCKLASSRLISYIATVTKYSLDNNIPTILEQREGVNYLIFLERWVCTFIK